MFPTNTTSSSNNITINNVTVDDEGVYTCTVSNEGGNSSYDIFINIIGCGGAMIQYSGKKAMSTR